MDNEFWKSKKFWALVLSVLLAIAKGFGADIPVEAFYGPAGYMLGQGIADAGKGKK